MLKNDVLALIYEWQTLILKRRGVERDIEASVLATIPSKPIKIISGFRRTGKSFLAQRIAMRLVDDGKFKIDNILYLNFEDYRLSEINTAQRLADIHSIFLSDIAKQGPKLIVLDEIQNVSGWDKFVRTIYEMKDDIQIIITGSNSELLSAELGTNLAGRFIEFFMLPFNFREFLLYKNVRVKDLNEYLKHRPDIERSFSEYLKYGGLPETFEIATEDAKFSYLKGIITKVVLDDIVKRFGVDNVNVLEKLLYYILSNVGTVISYTKIKNRMKLLGADLKVETVIKYIGYFLKSFTILEVNKFDWKQSKIFSSSKKYYVMDLGLASIYRPIIENSPRRLENLVLLNLRRSFEKICYGVNERGREIDFIVDDGNGGFDKYQVTAELEQHNIGRELGVFGLADKYLKKGRNFLLTLKDCPDNEQFKEHKIININLIRWLLGV